MEIAKYQLSFYINGLSPQAKTSLPTSTSSLEKSTIYDKYIEVFPFLWLFGHLVEKTIPLDGFPSGNCSELDKIEIESKSIL